MSPLLVEGRINNDFSTHIVRFRVPTKVSWFAESLVALLAPKLFLPNECRIESVDLEDGEELGSGTILYCN